jgi:hypothetical protein
MDELLWMNEAATVLARRAGSPETQLKRSEQI